MDKFEQLISEAQFAVCILANLDTSDFELVDLDGKELPSTQQFSARALQFGGVMAVVDGLPRVVYAEPFDEEMCRALVDAFIQIKPAESLMVANLTKRLGYLTRIYEFPKMVC